LTAAEQTLANMGQVLCQTGGKRNQDFGEWEMAGLTGDAGLRSWAETRAGRWRDPPD